MSVCSQSYKGSSLGHTENVYKKHSCISCTVFEIIAAQVLQLQSRKRQINKCSSFVNIVQYIIKMSPFNFQIKIRKFIFLVLKKQTNMAEIHLAKKTQSHICGVVSYSAIVPNLIKGVGGIAPPPPPRFWEVKISYSRYL